MWHHIFHCEMAEKQGALTHAIAAASATAVVFSALFPIDTLRLRMQSTAGKEHASSLTVLRAILRDEGGAALFRGIQPSVLAMMYVNFVFFFAQTFLKNGKTLVGTRALAVPALSGLIVVVLSAPVMVVSTRLRLSDGGLMACIRAIAATDGLAGFFKGLGPSLWLTSNPAIQYAIYERLKILLRPRTALHFFLIGAIAKSFSTFTTYPLQLAQTLLRAQGKRIAQTGPKAGSEQGTTEASSTSDSEAPRSEEEYAGMWDCLRKVHARGGTAALYRGLQAKAVQTILTAALQNMAYERLIQLGSQRRRIKEQ